LDFSSFSLSLQLGVVFFLTQTLSKPMERVKLFAGSGYLRKKMNPLSPDLLWLTNEFQNLDVAVF